jgi:hypothetical protein
MLNCIIALCAAELFAMGYIAIRHLDAASRIKHLYQYGGSDFTFMFIKKFSDDPQSWTEEEVTICINFYKEYLQYMAESYSFKNKYQGQISNDSDDEFMLYTFIPFAREKISRCEKSEDYNAKSKMLSTALKYLENRKGRR